MHKKILIVAAHPDDEILGCGGAIAKFVNQGYKATVLILGEGITARHINKNDKQILRKLNLLRKQIRQANIIIGVKEVYTYNYPDNMFDTVDFLDIVRSVESIRSKIKPDIIFTHHSGDLNIDHQITYNAVLTAARPLPGNDVKEIYSFEIPSSSEWRYPNSFSPDLFIDITSTMILKKKAILKYSGELRDFPHPRSLKGIEINARSWGMKSGLNYAEAFKCIRIIR